MKPTRAWPQERRAAVDARRAPVFLRYLECRDVRKVAGEFGLSMSGVRNAIRHGIARSGQRPPGVARPLNSRALAAVRVVEQSSAMKAAGLTTADIAKRLGVSRGWIRSRLKAGGIAIDEPRASRRPNDAEIARLHALGLSGRAIAKTLDLHESTVSKIRKRLRLRKRTLAPTRAHRIAIQAAVGGNCCQEQQER